VDVAVTAEVMEDVAFRAVELEVGDELELEATDMLELEATDVVDCVTLRMGVEEAIEFDG
jgi:hypothetical protein